MSKKNGDGEDDNGKGGDDYEIGYKKPPIHSRWRKGQSGNKKGRPKKKLGPSDIEKAFDEALGDWLAVNDNGTVRKIKKLKAFTIQTVNKALKGHHQSANLLMAHYARRPVGGAEESGSSSTTEEFRAELEAQFREMAAKSQSAAAASGEAEKEGDGDSDPWPPDDPSPDTKQ